MIALFPQFCRSCSVSVNKNKVFCNACESRILKIPSKYTGDIEVVAISSYCEPIKQLVLRKMYYDRLASRQLGVLLYERTSIKEIEFDFILPVPLHWSRYAWRGFNQSLEMAKVVSRKTGLPVISLLKRKKRTTFQSRLSKEKRDENVKNVFVIKNCYKKDLKKILDNKTILIVDDLSTTGSTLQSIVRTLKKYGVKRFVAGVACST